MRAAHSGLARTGSCTLKAVGRMPAGVMWRYEGCPPLPHHRVRMENYRTLPYIQAGEPLTISYGSKENAELLYGRALDLRGRDVELCAHALQQFIRYGFALRSNPSDAALLRLPLAPAADPTFGVQRAALTPRGMLDEEDCFWLPLGWSCDGPRWAPLLLMMLRLAAASSTAELLPRCAMQIPRFQQALQKRTRLNPSCIAHLHS